MWHNNSNIILGIKIMAKKIYTTPLLKKMGNLINKTLGSSGSKNEPHVAENRPK